jgi:anti-sigma B factor antagonist
MAAIEFETQQLEGVKNAVVIKVAGALTVQTIPDFRLKIEEMIEKGFSYYIIDFAKVKFINSTGIGCLISLADSLGREKFILSQVQPNVKIVFEMLGLKGHFKMYDRLEEATRELAEKFQLVKRTTVPITTEPPSPPLPDLLKVREAIKPKPSPLHPKPAVTVPKEIICRSCETKLIVQKAGLYHCPNCVAVFKYEKTGEVIFLPHEKSRSLYLVGSCSKETKEGVSQIIDILSQGHKIAVEDIKIMKRMVSVVIDRIKELAYENKENGVVRVFINTDEHHIEVQLSDTGRQIEKERLAFVGEFISKFYILPGVAGKGNLIILRMEV